jgi:riboflavin transporter FmnP
MNMCGFSSTTDLGKMGFYFSCKNYSSKVYTSFAKVVGFVTRSSEKLVLQFYDFLPFYMDFPKHCQNTPKG